MYSFEGEYRRRPEQLLAGHSVNQDREQLLQKAQLQRLQRRQLQRQSSAAVRLQAFIRGCLSRARIRADLRQRFDQKLPQLNTQSLSIELMRQLIEWLVWFYQQPCESDWYRLVSVGQLLLRHDHIRRRLVTDRRHSHGRLLALMASSLSAAVTSSRQMSLAVPLRLLEVSLSSSREESDQSAVRVILPQLMDCDYWRHVRLLVDNKLPELDEDTLLPPVPIASSVLTLILRPLELSNCCSAVNSANVAGPSSLLLFISQLLKPPLSTQVRHFVLPMVIHHGAISLSKLLHVLEGVRCGGQRSPLTPGIWLLYTLLRLSTDSARDSLSGADARLYLQVLGWCAGSCPLNSSGAAVSSDRLKLDSDSEPDDDDDDNDAVDIDMAGGSKVRVMTDILNLLNSPHLVHWIRRTLDSAGDDQTSGMSVCGGHSVVLAICGLCFNLLQTDRLALHRYMFLYSLAFHRRFLARLWHAIESYDRQSSLAVSQRSLLLVMARGAALETHERRQIVPPLATFCAMMAHMLVTLQDSELSSENNDNDQDGTMLLFSLSRLVEISAILRDVYWGLINLAYPDLHQSVPHEYSSALRDINHEDPSPASTLYQHTLAADTEEQTAPADWLFLLPQVSNLLWQLQSRDSRLHFCPTGHWSSRMQPLPADRVVEVARLFSAEATAYRRQLRPFSGPVRYTRDHLTAGNPILSARDVRTMILLRHVPFMLSFRQRVQLFQELLRQDRLSSQSELDHFMSSEAGNSIQITVRRNYLYEDAFEKLSIENEPTLKPRMRVTMINAKGLDEAGIDGGGIFREFLTELLRTSFDPNRGFFCLTTGSDQQQLYPNPYVGLLIDDPAPHYFFIGRALGKAIYEQLLVELPMAAFFLVKLLGRRSERVDVHYLRSLDPELYRHLMSLGSGGYSGDVSELGLDFSVHVSQLGVSRQVELKPGGANIAVTSDNCVEYIHLMAGYKLNRQIERQCSALRLGLADVVPLRWLQMFDYNELQTLVSGAPVPVDVDDLRIHTRYAGGFSEQHPVISNFWRVVSELNEQQRCQLLRFVTSCSRPPLLGFRELHPPFCIHSAGAGDEHRLPSASTCMNLLKLPEYSSSQLLRDKLIYAIEAEPGFELS